MLLLLVMGCLDGEEGGIEPAVPTSTLLQQLSDPSVTRSGEPPPLSSDPPVRTNSPCGFSIDIAHLFSLSNARLAAIGAGRISPLVVLQDGVPLRGFATSGSFEDRCEGASNVGRNVVRFSPDGPDPDSAAAHTYTLALSPEVPLQTPTGPVWWVHPGTALSLSFPDSALTGRSLTLSVVGWISQGRIEEQPVISVGTQEVLMRPEGDQWRGDLLFSVPEGAWQAEIRISDLGPHLALSDVTLRADGTRRDLLAQTPSPTPSPTP
jgi:hypothetical protein